MKERLAKAKEFIRKHEWEVMTVIATTAGWSALYLLHLEKKNAFYWKQLSEEYLDQLCDITLAAHNGYTMSYDAENEMILFTAPKEKA